MIPIIDEISKQPTFIASDFDEPILYAPSRTDQQTPCNSLRIISAFTDCERISTHMIRLAEGMKEKRFRKKIKVELILGMTKSSLSQRKHEDICRLLGFIREEPGMPSISCRYISSGPEVHSKVYIWSCSDERCGELPYVAYCGSLNYTMNAFFRRRESVCMCNPQSALEYYNQLYEDTIDCFDPQVAEKLRNVINNGPADAEEPDNSESEYNKYDQLTPIGAIEISLLQANGQETGYGSGINWGIRPNGTKRNLDQAYIPYNRQDRIEGFFPDRKHPDDENCPMFKVITKDFGSFHMRMAQANNKALHSVESNAILGKWIRQRIGVPSGGLVTKQMLENYGSTKVRFRKYEDGTYLLDF